MSDPDCVKVAVRIRPMVESEYARGCKLILQKTINEPQIIINSGKNNDLYTFNHVFSPEDQQDLVYTESVQKLLDKLFLGYNVTILAYGQTGSGKTHTMGTTFEGLFDDSMGVIPRAMDDIFHKIDQMPDKDITVKCSFMELYQEQLYDLLSDGTREDSIVDIREDNVKGIVIPDLTEVRVTSPLQTTNCLIRGSSLRAVGATAMNKQSSRSHAVFSVSLEIRTKNGPPDNLITARFHLVDLAGSERSKKTKATGNRFKEGVKINQGLLALGNVISALGSGNNNFITYRDSKLTRLLQDSLGGNSVTLMIACVSPADYNLEETLSTLRYADRARKIKNKPIINQDPQQAEINKLNQIIQKLRMDLLNYSGNCTVIGGIGGGGDNNQKTSTEYLKWNNELITIKEKNRLLQSQLQITLVDVVNIEMKAILAETANDQLQIKINDLKKLIFDLNTSFNQETCPVDFLIHVNELDEIRQKIEEIDQILSKNKDELSCFNKTTNSNSNLMMNNNNSLSRDSLNDQSENDQIKLESLTLKQIGFSNELRNLNKQLELKEELHQQFLGNLTNFCSYENELSSTNKLQEYQIMIKNLEHERDDLNEKIKYAEIHVTSTKIAEERRKKMEQLELKVNEFKKKIEQQEKLLKLREKDTLRINTLNNEIKNMKTTKVKLIRAMKQESDNFRLWKINRDREMLQLKEKDRKRQNEIARMNCLHSKQKNVLKRKYEEVLAVTKRYQTAIDKQKNAQMQRNKGNKNNTSNNTNKLNDIPTMLGYEIDIILSVIDAKQSLDYAIEERTLLNERLNELKENSSTDQNEIKSLEDELNTRNTQIKELHEKIVSSNIDEKIQKICDNLHHIPEAQLSLKHILTVLIELKTDIITKNDKYEKLECDYEKKVENSKELELIKQENDLKYMKEINTIEKNHEEKTLVLIKELNKISGKNNCEDNNNEQIRLKIHEETLQRLDQFKKEYEQLQNENFKLNKIMDQTRFKRPRSYNKNNTQNCLDISSDLFSEFDDEDDDDENDPDWRMTPLRLRNSRTSRELNNTSHQLQPMELTKKILKRKSETIKCKCKDCSTLKCTCRKNKNVCNENCKCSNACKNNVLTQNGNGNDDNGNDDTNKEETIKINQTINIEDEQNITPKKKRLSEGENIMDVTTPSYPYADKKKKQFYHYC